MPSGSWSRQEVEATVQDYLDMLATEIRGEPFNKAAHNRTLRRKLNGRSRGAVERKHQNISAVLIDLDRPYINGYKPLGNIQGMLREIVPEHLAELDDLVAADVAAPQDRAVVDDVLEIMVEPPAPTQASADGSRYAVRDIVGVRDRVDPIDYLRREALNRTLGDAGEDLVMEFERVRLRNAGEERLAEKVEQVSKTVGDQAGFDIRSYDADGRDRFIEVKTTRYGKYTPFYISAGEVRFSGAHADAYHLYRLFEFRRAPRLFVLPGDVRGHARLQPTNYRAHL